jgi:TPR repeat protein
MRRLGLPFAFAVGLAAFTLLPRVSGNPVLIASFGAACAGLLIWLAVLGLRTRSNGRELTLEVSLKPQHYLQAIAHTSILVYWGFYWPPLKDAAPLIAAQIVFAYAFDMLLTWSRRDGYSLGFGPFPIIYSTNLFMRFHDDYFYLQFVMVAIGFLAKELLRWNRDGRRVHIFNPSSFPLALCSLLLIFSGNTGMTWGEDIASLLILPPQMYLFIFVMALPGQFLFRVTTMTLSAVLTTYGFSVAYLAATGTYFFFDSSVPIAVFLGMHLLFTDPSTSPRTELGRIIFGVMYGASVVGLYALLGWLGVPTFYDKLLQVPIMNLMVRAIDRAAAWRGFRWCNPERLASAAAPWMRSVVYVSLWIVVFGGMTAANGVGDHHPGHTIRFWETACQSRGAKACENLAILESGPCRNGSGWACNELGILVADGRVHAAPAADLFSRACDNGSGAGCANTKAIANGAKTFQHGDPRVQDYVWILREGKGPIVEQSPLDVYGRACAEGWVAGCGALAGVYFKGDGVVPDKARAASLLLKACDAGHGPSCSNLGLMYERGDGVAKDHTTAVSYLRRACAAGLARACDWLAAQGG